MSMPSYVPAALKLLKSIHIDIVSTPMLAITVQYGSNNKTHTADVETSPTFDPARRKRLQVICGIFLYSTEGLLIFGLQLQ